MSPRPYLFIIVAEALNIVVKNAIRMDILKVLPLPLCNTQQIISEYANNTSFTTRAKEVSVYNLIRILRNFGIAFGLKINWHYSIAHWCSQGTPPGQVQKYQRKWAATRDSSKLLGTPFGLHLELQNVYQIFIDRIKAKLKYWSSTHLSLRGRPFIVNHMLMSFLWYFITVWVGSKKVWGKVKAVFPNYLWCGSANTTHTRVQESIPVLANIFINK